MITGLKGSKHNFGKFKIQKCKFCKNYYKPYHPRQKFSCEECQRGGGRILTKRWYNRNKNKKKIYHLKYYYNISLEDYNKLLKDQNYKCAICEKEKDLHIDHCHKTGKIRGLLCSICNRALGIFGDDEEGISKVLRYLKKE